MLNVVPITASHRIAPPLLRHSYGQKLAWRAYREPLPSKAQPTVTNSDETKTLRIRPNIAEKESTLPLPPLMDPIAVAARERHKQPKRRVQRKWQSTTEFRDALAVNPFAQALATSVRCCSLTKARLPSHFLQRFSAHFRVKNGTIKGYIGAHMPSSANADGALDSEPEGQYSGSTREKTYTLNSQELLRAVSRKKRNQQFIITKRMREAYELRTKALSAQTGSSAKASEEWVWLSSVEQSKSVLVNEVVEALAAYAEKVPDAGHLIPLSRLEQIPHRITSQPLALTPWDSSASPDVDGIAQSDADEEVSIPAYDLRILDIVGKLTFADLRLDQELNHSGLLGILHDRQTLKLHLALQRLASFLGEKTACKWIVVKKEDLEDAIMKLPWVSVTHERDSEIHL